MKTEPTPPISAQQINDALKRHSDKDWNYSRIHLQLRPLVQINSPYVLHIETIELTERPGKDELARLRDEIAWGSRHSDELGILEIISLRVNKALLESTSDEYWGNHRPVVRIVKTQDLVSQGVTYAFWYEVEEVGGEEFDSR
jgi:hypothetical protein